MSEEYKSLPVYDGVMKSIVDPILKYIDRIPDEMIFFLTGKERETDIFMHHGISDKGYHKIDRLKKISHMFYMGPSWKRKLMAHGIPEDKITLVGWPPLDAFFNGEIKIAKRNGIRIAWCPTHNAIQAISSYPAFERYAHLIPENYELVSSTHPSERRYGTRETSLELVANSDVVLSDTSSMLYEALIIGKPVILLDFLVKKGVMSCLRGTFDSLLYSSEVCYHAETPDDLPRLIEQALYYGISRKTRAFIDDYFPVEFRGNSGLLTANKLKELTGV